MPNQCAPDGPALLASRFCASGLYGAKNFPSRKEAGDLDVPLPDRSGFEVCAALLQANGAAREVVLVSSRDACDYGGLIASCGACGFVPKAELSGDAVSAFLETREASFPG